MNDWKRQFPYEKIGRLDQFLHGWRGGVARPFFIASEQANFVDTNFYYRVGGVDPDKARQHNDILAIQWGIGSRKTDTFDDQVAVAKSQNLKYFTWCILDVADAKSIEEQVEIWHDTEGATEAPMFIDQERPRSSTRYLNVDELRRAVTTIRSLSDYRVGCYSRVNIFESLFDEFPTWMEDVAQWIAQYLLHWDSFAWVPYRYYDDFLKSWSWSLPPAVIKSNLYKDSYWREMVEAWQFTDKGDAEYYIAPEWIYPGQPGIKSCDLNVSIKPLHEFMQSIFGEVDPIPPPEPQTGDKLRTLFDSQALRSEPSTDGGNSTVVKRLARNTVLDVVPDASGKTLHVPGLSLPKDVWVHVEDDSGVSGWVAIYHSSRSTVYLETV